MPPFELNKNQVHRPKAEKWRIEGRSLTQLEIAEELGITKAAVAFRMGKLRHASGAITMDRLRAIGK